LPLEDIKKIYINVGRRDKPTDAAQAILSTPDDNADIALLLKSFKAIKISKDRVRSHGIRDFIFIEGETVSKLTGEKIPIKIKLYGCFDPENAPIISPALR
jgi:hypothetical protein